MALMQIDILPVPNITGATNVERLNNLIAYVTQLHNMLRVILTAIDKDNLTADLASQIEKSIKEQQDLGAYSTIAYVNEKGDSVLSTANSNASSYASSAESNANSYTNNQISAVEYNFDRKLSNKSDASHNHDGRYQPYGEVPSHSHSDYASKSHTHDNYLDKNNSQNVKTYLEGLGVMFE